jgi:speckle-type POZ protein
MSSFNGVSVVADGRHCTTTAINIGMADSAYHLLVVKGYSRTVQEVPNGMAIRSGSFTVGGHKWCILYFPNGHNPDCADYMSLYIYLLYDEDLEEAVVETKFQFTFVDEVEYQKPVYIRATETYDFSMKNHCAGSMMSMERDALNRSSYLKDDCFTIRCDVVVCRTSKDADATLLSDIHDDFSNLLQDKMGSDVTFEVGGETFAAHRCVLAARSKVFKAELFGPGAESTTSSAIRIKDMEAKVFAALLRFIYTDSFPEMDIDKNMEGGKSQVDKQEQLEYVMWLQDLFVAADRYDLQRLKFVCEKHFSEHMCVSSVASILVVAQRQHCHRLKEACFKFIQVQSPECLEKLMVTDGWKHITTTYPSVLNEIIAKLASNQKGKKKRW